MNLRKKTILAIAATFIGVMGIGSILAHKFFLESFRVLEHEEIVARAENFHYLLDNELNDLGNLASDWAEWDDSYSFMESADQTFVQSNLVQSTFEDLGLSSITLIDNEGRIVFGKTYDSFNNEFQPIAGSTKKFFTSLLPASDESIASGYYSDNSQLVLFSANPILTSAGTGPSRGILIFTRNFAGQISDHLSTSIKSTINIKPANYFDSENYKVMNNHQDILYNDNDRNNVKFVTFISDINGDPIFSVEQMLPRTIYQRGFASMRTLLLSVGAAGLIASVISMTALEKGFLSRLSRLTDGIRNFDETNGKDGKKILLKGADELSKLSHDVYSALVSLSTARDESAEHLELEKLLVTISSKFINLPISEIDKAINQVLETIGKFAKVDRSYLLMIREEEPLVMDNAYEWCSPGTPSVMDELHNVDLGNFSWWHNQMKSGKSILVEDINDLPKAAEAEKEIFASQSIKSIANIPLFINGALAGSLGFDTVKEKVDWTEEINILLEVVGGIISNALDRQRHEINLSESRALHQRRSAELDALRDTIADITSELEINKLLQTILERAIKLLDADGGDFCVFDEQEQALKVVAIVNMNKKYLNTWVQLNEGAAGKAAAARETIILEDYSNWDEKMNEYEEARLRSALVTPLMIGSRLLGTVGMFQYSPEKQFSEEDQHLLSMFAQHASIALDNAMLFERIQELARIDEVTGLLNRRSFVERADYEINRARRLDHSLALAMIDLDNFKEINDKFSHQVGDQVLKEIANLLQINIRNIDILGRYGGDEITLLMPETTRENALHVLQRLNKLLAEHEFVCGVNRFRITASIGLASYPVADVSFEKMISAADEALYRAKDSGRNRVSL